VWREQLLEQRGRVRLEEANEWRAALTYPLSAAQNIVLGFDPSFDFERRQDLDLFSVPGGTTVAATLIRGRF
jgi:hypothetical protein